MKRLVGASIIPISIDPVSNNIYILLGREKWNHKYSDFGGVATSKDPGPADAAAREFNEETACLIPYFTHENTRSFKHRHRGC